MMLKRFLCLMLFALTVLPTYAQPGSDDCRTGSYLPTRLLGYQYARVTTGAANNVRESYGLSSPVVDTIGAGTVVTLTSAVPVCLDGYMWYQVMYRPPTSTSDYPFGYTVEGDLATNTYFLEPVEQFITTGSSTAMIDETNLGALVQVGDVGTTVNSQASWSDDSQRLAVGATIYDLTTGRSSVYASFTNKPFTVLDVAFASDNLTYAFAGAVEEDPSLPTLGGIQVWNAADPVNVSMNAAPVSDFNNFSAAIHLGIAQAAFGQRGGNIVVLKLPDNTLVTTLAGPFLIGDLSFSRAGNRLVVEGGDGMASDTDVYVWDTSNWTLLATVPGNSAPHYTAISNDGTLVARTDINPRDPTIQQVLVTDVPFSSISTTYFLPSGVNINGLDISPDNRLVAIGANDFNTGDSYILFVNIATGRDVGSLPIPAGADVEDISFSPDGRMMSVIYTDPLFWPPRHLTLWAVP